MERTLKRLSTLVLLSVTLMVLGGWAIATSAQAPVCDPALLEPGCLYFPSARYEVSPTITATITYTDIAGLQRSVPIAIRIPISAPLPMPVVIWSHGGAGGHTSPERSSVEWSEDNRPGRLFDH